jgi:adenine/guanine phosphoribosyltransferase-like PRPP-binding protein
MLAPGAAGFTLGRAIFASRLGSANLVYARRFRGVSWQSFYITADTTTPTFRL